MSSKVHKKSQQMATQWHGYQHEHYSLSPRYVKIHGQKKSSPIYSGGFSSTGGKKSTVKDKHTGLDRGRTSDRDRQSTKSAYYNFAQSKMRQSSKGSRSPKASSSGSHSPRRH